MSYNQSFIENDKLIEVEKVLEASRNLDNIYCTFKVNRLVSVIMYIEDIVYLNSQAVIDLFEKKHDLVPNNFVYVTKNYFEKIVNFDFINKAYIISFTADNDYRGKDFVKNP